MTHVITGACIGTNEASCVEVCPVDCIHRAEKQHVIDPTECIDCGACLPDCPVDAIYEVVNLPEELHIFSSINAAFGSGIRLVNELIDQYQVNEGVERDARGA